MGADEVILPMVTEYMNIWFIGLPLFALPMVAMSMLRALGNARIPGALMTAGAAVQVVSRSRADLRHSRHPRRHRLHGFGVGVRHSRFLTLLATAYVLTRRGMIRPLGDWNGVLRSWREVLRIGVPSIMTNLVGPVSMGVVFGLLAKYGHAVVAGFGVAIRIESLAVMILMAMSSSISPMVGQNWGAGQQRGSTKRCGSATAFRSRGACSSSSCWRCSDAASSG